MDLRALPSLPHWFVPSARLRIALTYLWRHHRLPDMAHPRRFSELVQRRKLDDRDRLLPLLADKIAVKSYIRDRIGENWIIPTLWSGAALPAEPCWPYPFILKASHGCNQTVICHHASDWPAARRRAARWTRRPYGLWLDEWAYRDVPRGYIVEPYLGQPGKVPEDYKVYVFGGRAAFVQVHLERFTNHRWVLHDRDWNPLARSAAPACAKPGKLSAMLASAEIIAQPFSFARVDFYDIDGIPKFGEVTFYPGSGLDPFDPPELDQVIGSLWLEAQAEIDRSRGTTAPHSIAA